MNLPLSNPPLGWKVSRQGEVVTLDKMAGVTVTNDHVVGAVVVGLCPIVFTTAVQWLTTSTPVLEILLRWGTLKFLLFLPVLVAAALWAKRLLGYRYAFEFAPGKLTLIRNEHGKKYRDEVLRERVRSLTRYVAEQTQDDEEEISLVLEWRAPNGEDTDLYLGLFPAEDQGEWFLTLFEAWSGHRARLGVLEEEFAEEENEPSVED